MSALLAEDLDDTCRDRQNPALGADLQALDEFSARWQRDSLVIKCVIVNDVDKDSTTHPSVPEALLSR